MSKVGVFCDWWEADLDIERKKDILLLCFVLHLFNSVCFAWNCSLLFYGLGDLGGGCSARVVATAMLRWGGVLLLLLLALLENRLLVSGGPEGHHFAVAGLTICGGPEPLQALIEGGPRLDGVLWLPEHRSGHLGPFLIPIPLFWAQPRFLSYDWTRTPVRCSFDSVYLFYKTKRVTIVLVTIPAAVAGTPPAGERLNQPSPMREARRMIRWAMRKQDGRGNCCCTRVGKRCRRNHSTRIWFNNSDHTWHHYAQYMFLVLKQGHWLLCAIYTK